jgi:tetratricopeptide (TPR) repeat protein
MSDKVPLLPRTLLKLAAAIIKHQIKQRFGEEGLAIALSALSEVAGDELTDKLRSYYQNQEEAQKVLEAFKQADECFKRMCEVDALRQAIHELPLSGATTLHDIALTLPSTLDSDNLRNAIRQVFSQYWIDQLDDDLLDQASMIYLFCLDRALATSTDQLGATIFRKVEQIEINTDELLAGYDRLQITATDILMNQERLENEIGLIRESLDVITRTSGIATSTPEVDTKSLNRQELAINSKLDQCFNLLKTGNPKVARKALTEIENEIKEHEVSDLLRFKLHTLLGRCALDLREDGEAIDQFERAYRFAGDNPQAISNVALVSLMQGKLQKALDLSDTAISRGEVEAYAVRVATLAQMQDFKELENLIEEDNLNLISYVRALGFAFFEAGEYSKAKGYLQRALDMGCKGIPIHLTLASAITSQEIGNLASHSLDPILKDAEWHKSINDALGLVEIALIEARSGDNPFLITDALAMRAGLLGTLGDLDNAKADCEEVLRESPDHVGALHNRVVIAMLQEEYQLALDLANRLPEGPGRDPFIVFTKARALIETNKPQNALTILEEAYESEQFELFYPYQSAVIKARALSLLGRKEEAQKVKDTLHARGKNDHAALEACATIEIFLDNSIAAIEDLEIAYDLADTKYDRSRIALRLSDQMLRRGDHDAAIRWFEQSDINPVADIHLARNYIAALVNVERYDRAFVIVQRIRLEQGVEDPFVMEVEAFIAERLGQLELAHELDARLSELYPTEFKHRINLARIEFRRGCDKAGRTILQEINEYQIHDAYQLMLLARMHLLVGAFDRALAIGYRALRKGMDSPEIHLGYSMLFLHVDELIEGLDPETVSYNTAVRMVSGGQSLWVTILESEEPEATAFEFPADSEIARHLLGKHKGEIVDLRSGPLEHLSYEIKEIQSIYVRAFQESFAYFSTRFPGHLGIQRMQIVDHDFTPFLVAVAGKSSLDEAIYQAYRKGLLTLEQFGRIIGRNRIDVISGLMAIADRCVFASAGTHEEQEVQRKLSDEAPSIALDLSSLITLSYLDLLPELNQRFDNLYIPQHLIDELMEIRDDRHFMSVKGYKSITFKEGHFILDEISSNEITKSLDRIEELIAYVREKCQVVGIPTEQATFLTEPDQSLSDIGLISKATIIIAKQTNSPLLSDDARLRSIAHREYGVPGFWTQALLKDLNNKGMISSEKYVEACVKLLLAGYTFTSVSEDLIVRVLKNHLYQTNPETMAAIEGLKGPETLEDDAIRIGAGVITNLWMTSIPREQRLFQLWNILNTLVRNREPAIVLIKLETALSIRMASHDYLLNEVLQEVRNWNVVRGLAARGM